MGSAHNVFYHGPDRRARAVGPLAAVLCLLLATGAAVGGTLWWQSRDADGGADRARPPADTRPRPAPSGSPPVLVASVTGPVSDLPGRDFARRARSAAATSRPLCRPATSPASLAGST